ncbi:endonuclease exonuclease phosphatase domain containing protein [Plakobranchus ocellatus]|uniref:Endonuclease exonuclease phosphatase domain containing protein n=1 Tax=Plakobranchus ocellatus TaxID=259542 RepID=A0AAV4DP79_9GAST|nr:endonuclease exonuclease phosphatase domain containing protein [Plakobranchus ocellatus]
MERIKLNILGLAEVRWTGTDSMKLWGKTLIYSGGHTHERGVGILFDVTMAKSLGSWCPVSDRVVVATWYQNHPRRQWTWKSPGDRSRSEIDYILIQKRF